MTPTRSRVRRAVGAAALLLATLPQTVRIPSAAGAADAVPLVISELRYAGDLGDHDEYIEITNASSEAHTVAGANGSAGYALVTSDGNTRCTIPNGTVVPPFGSYLCAGALYSLGNHPGGDGEHTSPDATFIVGMPDNAGVALFDSSGTADRTLAHRIDAVGTTAVADALYREGAGIATVLSLAAGHVWLRDTTSLGWPLDTDDNAGDFRYLEGAGANYGPDPHYGVPGPSNLTSPRSNSGLVIDLLDPCVGPRAEPNLVRDTTPGSPQTSSSGTLEIRRTITNVTGGSVTRLRLRVVDVSTYPPTDTSADLRLLTTDFDSTTVDRAPCGTGTSSTMMHGTLLAEPPAQPVGGGVNSLALVTDVTPNQPLLDQESIDVRILVGVERPGDGLLQLVAEAVTDAPTQIGPAAPYCVATTSPIEGVDQCWGNSPPPPGAEAYATAESTTLTVPAPGVLGNDGPDPDGDAVEAELIDPALHGDLALQPDGSFTYTPEPGFVGEDYFNYTPNDGSDTSSLVRVDLTVSAASAPASPAPEDAPTTPESPASPTPADDAVDAVEANDTGDAHDTGTVVEAAATDRDSLPRTGFGPVPMLGLAVTLVAAGTVAVAAARRRQASTH